MELWKVQRTTILEDLKLISAPKSWCSHNPTQHAAKGIREDSVTRGCQEAQIYKKYMSGKRRGSGQEKVLVIVMPRNCILGKGVWKWRVPSICKAVHNWVIDVFLRKWPWKKTKSCLTMKLNMAHRTRRELKLTSKGSPKAKYLLLTAVNFTAGTVLHGGRERQWCGAGAGSRLCEL